MRFVKRMRFLRKQKQSSDELTIVLEKAFKDVAYRILETYSVYDTGGYGHNIAIRPDGAVRPLSFDGGGIWRFDGQFYFREPRRYISLRPEDLRGDFKFTGGKNG